MFSGPSGQTVLPRKLPIPATDNPLLLLRLACIRTQFHLRVSSKNSMLLYLPPSKAPRSRNVPLHTVDQEITSRRVSSLSSTDCKIGVFGDEEGRILEWAQSNIRRIICIDTIIPDYVKAIDNYLRVRVIVQINEFVFVWLWAMHCSTNTDNASKFLPAWRPYKYNIIFGLHLRPINGCRVLSYSHKYIFMILT